MIFAQWRKLFSVLDLSFQQSGTQAKSNSNLIIMANNNNTSGPFQNRTIKIGTRGSQLALVQTNAVKAELEALFPNIKIETQIIKTKGDKILDVALSKIGDKGLFTKELEVALLNKDIDFAVHSLKDIPTKLPEGLCIGAITKRETPNDCAVMSIKNKDVKTIADLPPGSVIGSSSLRRVAQLQRAYPHLKFKDVRGNLNSRLQKLDENGEFSALILAVAGLSRLSWKDRISQVLPTDLCLHAVGQGALGIECRSEDKDLLKLLSTIHDNNTMYQCEAERSFLRETEGGCQVPIGVSTQVQDGQLQLKAIVLSIDGTKAVKDEITGSVVEAIQLGQQLATKMKQQGAEAILQEVFEANSKGMVVKEDD